MSGLVKHAETELKLTGLFDKDSDYGGMLGSAVMELITVFANQGHSGCSANLVSNLFNKLSRYEPLTPLKFSDDEWCETSGGVFQNKRNSAVFKDGVNGRPYYIDAFIKIAIFPDGHKSGWNGTLDVVGGKCVRRCYIRDPKQMPTIKIELPVCFNGNRSDEWGFYPATEEQLGELKRYYDFELEKQ